MSDTILTGRNLTRQFPKRPRPALDGVDIDIRAGVGLGIVGESGAGKTTLLRLLLGVDQPTGGEVEFAGQPLRRADRRDFRRQVQVVFQDPRSSLNPRLPVDSIVAEPLRSLKLGRSRAERADRVAEVLTAVGLRPEDGRRYPHEFSGGQRQRIAIARALAPSPRLLLADEPVSALDVSVRLQIIELLRDLVDRLGLTLVLVSHDLAIVSQLCQRVMVMRHGRVVESGPTGTLLTDPADDYTRALLAAIPQLPADLPLATGTADLPLATGTADLPLATGAVGLPLATSTAGLPPDTSTAGLPPDTGGADQREWAAPTIAARPRNEGNHE